MVPELLLGTYFVFILFSFIAPLAIVRTKLVEHKRTLAKEYSAAANSANARLKKRWLRDDGDAVKHYAELLQALRTSNSWPIRGSVAARFSVSSIAFPLLSALISAISKGYLGK